MSSKDVVVLNEPIRRPLNLDFTTPPELREDNFKDPCPPELEYFKHIDQLLIKQVKELVEILTGFETQNRYRVFNSLGQQVFYIQEESGCCWRYCCGPNREFMMHITDNTNKEVMRLRRPFECVAPCCVGCCDCCKMIMYVESPPGNVIGTINMDRYCCYMKLGLSDSRFGRFGTMNGPCCTCRCQDVPFPISSDSSPEHIGQTTKQWTGCCAESFTDADNFNVSFPMDMNPKTKAIMFASAILVDFLAYEHQNNNQNH